MQELIRHRSWLWATAARSSAWHWCGWSTGTCGGTGTIHIVWRGKASPDSNLWVSIWTFRFWWKTGKLWTKIQAPQSPCVAKNCPLRKVPRPRQLNATVGRCEGCVAKSAKGSQSGQNPGCLQGSKVEGDRVGRSYTDKSTQQVNKITFAPMNVKNKWLSSLMAIGNKWFCSLRKSELFTPPGVLGDAIIW